jgi:two-component system, chemotaxis family, protein-glutamate methylesterase/glutaminase
MGFILRSSDFRLPTNIKYMTKKYEIVIIGASLGGLHAVKSIIEMIPEEFPLPIVIVLHREAKADPTLQVLISSYGNLKAIEPEDKDEIKPGIIYLAPPNYHLLFEEDHFALTQDLPVNHARPSIDVLFESAAEAYCDKVIGIILTGSSKDGARGLLAIKNAGGFAIVQDPSTAESSVMPESALKSVAEAKILTLDKIAQYIIKLTK